MAADTQSWRDPAGKRHLVVEHDGNVPGFSAVVALLPEYHLGLVMLSNVSVSQLQASILDLVWNAVLGPWKERRKIEEGAALAEDATKAWLGVYSEGRIGVPPRALMDAAHAVGRGVNAATAEDGRRARAKHDAKTPPNPDD